MCSIITDDFDHETQVIPSSTTQKTSTICKKCTEKAAVLLQKKHSYCRTCFLNMVTHKFRSTLGKTKLIKNNERVLVAFYGDQKSTALLHLIKQGLSENAHKRLRFQPIVLFIDESTLWPSSLNRLHILTEVWSTFNDNFQSYVTKLSTVYSKCSITSVENVDLNTYLENSEQDLRLIECFNGIKSATSKLDFLVRLRYLVYVAAAKQLQCSKIFTSECGTDLSIRLLSDVILGRGAQIPFDTGICDLKITDVSTLRPLREITIKEITYYNVFNELEILPVPSVAEMFNVESSIQQVTESFVYNLQEEFPSTVYTIFHTGDKLKSIEKKSSLDNFCVLCYNELEQSTSESALSPCLNQINASTDNACGDCNCKKKKLNYNEINDSLCYGCKRLAKDLNSFSQFPDDVLERAKLHQNSKELRNKIEDCLL